jgi:hypothetical protein
VIFEMKDLAAIDTLALEHATGIVQGVGQDV